MPTETQVVKVDDLLAAWESLLPGNTELGAELLQRWSEPHRSYHTCEHLAQVLTMINNLARPSDELVEVQLAAWFHDAVYVIGADDNEAASAQLSIDRLAGLIRRPDEVARLIKVTAHHQPAVDDRPGALLCDADLAILASAPTEYDAYVAQIRQEYAAVDDHTFIAGRLRVLRGLRAGELFRTAEASGLIPAAIANLDREIAVLSAGQPYGWVATPVQ